MKLGVKYPTLPDLTNQVQPLDTETGYPANWAEISLAMRNWTGWKCEACGAQHDWESRHVLTIHHLDRNPMNNDPRNLLVCCQRCHLSIQANYHPGQIWLLGRPYWAQIRGL